jgi:hypothetical protein
MKNIFLKKFYFKFQNIFKISKKYYSSTLLENEIMDFKHLIRDKKYENIELLLNKELEGKNFLKAREYFEIFRNIDIPSQKLYISFIRIFLKFDKIDKAHEYFKYLKEHHEKPLLDIYFLFFNYYISKKDLNSCEEIYKVVNSRFDLIPYHFHSNMIQIYFKNKLEEKAMNIIYQLSEKKLSFDDKVIKTTIEYFYIKNEFATIENVFKLFFDRITAYEHIIDFYISIDRIQKAYAFLNVMVIKNYEVKEKTHLLFFDYHFIRGDKKALNTYIQKYVLEKVSFESINFMVSFYLKKNKPLTAEKFLSNIKKKYGLSPTDENYDKILKYYSSRNDFKNARRVHSIKKNRDFVKIDNFEDDGDDDDNN